LGRTGEVEPVDVAVGRQGLYVCNIKEHRVELWNRQSGALIKSFGGQGIAPGQLYMPTHLALDSDENIYVTDTGNFRVQKFSPDGKPLMQFGGHGDALGRFAWPKGLDLDGHGNLFVADSRFFNVQVFGPKGRLLLFFGGPGPDSGNLDLPSAVKAQPWPAAVGWLNARLAPGFDPETLVLVVSQEGEGLVNFFAVARQQPKTP
jgi:sugar lactone lactonase YvrE